MANSLVPPQGGGGDLCARGFDTSVRRSRWSWPRPVITPPEHSRRRSRRGGWQAKTRTKPYGDRRRPGQLGCTPTSSWSRGCRGGQSRSVTWLPECRRWRAIVSRVMTMASTVAQSASSSSSRLPRRRRSGRRSGGGWCRSLWSRSAPGWMPRRECCSARGLFLHREKEEEEEKEEKETSSYLQGRRHPCLYPDADLHGADVQNTIEIPIVLTQWPTSLLCGSCWFSGASVEKTLCSHSCSSLRKLLRRLCRGADADSHGPDCASDHGDSTVCLQHDDRRPGVQVQQVRVKSVRRQSCSHSCSPLSMDTVVAIPVVCNDSCRVV